MRFSVSNKSEVSRREMTLIGYCIDLLSDSYYLLFLMYFAANKEYYHQWSVEECHGCSLDLSAFTIEELDNITSEYTLKNTVGSHRYMEILQYT